MKVIFVLLLISISLTTCLIPEDDNFLSGENFVAEDVVSFKTDADQLQDLTKYIEKLHDYIMKAVLLNLTLKDDISNLIENLNKISKEFATELDDTFELDNNLIINLDESIKSLRETLIKMYYSYKYACKWLDSREQFMYANDEVAQQLYRVKIYLTDAVILINAYEGKLVEEINSIKSLIQEVIENAKNPPQIVINPRSLILNDNEDVSEAIEGLVEELEPELLLKCIKEAVLIMNEILKPKSFLNSVLDFLNPSIPL